MVKRLQFVVIALLLGLNIVPRMVDSVGTQRWFVYSVPQPERFAGTMEHRPAATWNFGYPFIFYFQVGHEFVTKEHNKLFWPSMKQPALTSRFSFVAFAGDVALSVGVGALMLIATNRYLGKTTVPENVSGTVAPDRFKDKTNTA